MPVGLGAKLTIAALATAAIVGVAVVAGPLAGLGTDPTPIGVGRLRSSTPVPPSRLQALASAARRTRSSRIGRRTLARLRCTVRDAAGRAGRTGLAGGSWARYAGPAGAGRRHVARSGRRAARVAGC